MSMSFLSTERNEAKTNNQTSHENRIFNISYFNKTTPGKQYPIFVGIPTGTNCAPLVANLFLLSNLTDFMMSLLDDKHPGLKLMHHFIHL